MQSSLRVSKPVIFFCAILFVMQFSYGVNITRIGYSERFYFWYVLAFYWALNWWFINDARNYAVPWVDKYMDMGMYLYVAWMFIVPYYLFRTRRWKAIYIIGLLLGTYFIAPVMGAVLYSLLSLF